jgi:DNA-binding NtrC family response regulator
LVVEDEILIRSATSEYLRDAGFSVVEASNALDAIAVISSLETVDLVFTDVEMSGEMNGSMLASWINEHHPSVPVIITSGAIEFPVESQAANFVRKPYILSVVEQKIRDLIDLSHVPTSKQDDLPG